MIAQSLGPAALTIEQQEMFDTLNWINARAGIERWEIGADHSFLLRGNDRQDTHALGRCLFESGIDTRWDPTGTCVQVMAQKKSTITPEIESAAVNALRIHAAIRGIVLSLNEILDAVLPWNALPSRGQFIIDTDDRDAYVNLGTMNKSTARSLAATLTDVGIVAHPSRFGQALTVIVPESSFPAVTPNAVALALAKKMITLMAGSRADHVGLAPQKMWCS